MKNYNEDGVHSKPKNSQIKHSEPNLIHKFQGISSSEYEGGHNMIAQKPAHHSKSLSQGLKFTMKIDDNLSHNDRHKLSKAMKYFSKNPKSLLDLVPEDSRSSVASKSQQKNHSRRGQCMIPDLGIVPPQSGVVNKTGKHLRKKSYNGFEGSNTSLNRELMNPTVARFEKNLKTINHVKPATANEASFNEYSYPNFMPNINQKVSSTMYKVSFMDKITGKDESPP